MDSSDVTVVYDIVHNTSDGPIKIFSAGCGCNIKKHTTSITKYSRY